MSEAPELRIQLTKRTDGGVVLRCIRRDGTFTWQRYDKHTMFYPFHDLRHFAIETTIGFANGFYGLIADGWDITDTTGKGARGRLSPDSILVEQIVGILDREQSGGSPTLSAAEFNSQLDTIVGADPDRPRFTEGQLMRVRARTEELHRQWAGLPAGSTMELAFSRSS